MPDSPAHPAMRAAPVLVYRDRLLSYADAWIQVQAEAMTRYEPWYAGARRVAEAAPPEARMLTLGSRTPWGRIAALAFTTTGRSRALRRWAARLRPVLIHAHGAGDARRLAGLARRLGVPLVVSCHGDDAPAPDASLLIASSDHRRQQLLERDAPPDRTVTLHAGVDTTFFTPDPRVGRCPIVLFVGRGPGLRGGGQLVRAMGDVVRVQRHAELVVIGDGPERPRLEAMAQRLLPRALFLGMQPPDKVRWWMNRASVLAAPAVAAEAAACEALALACAEAQAMGVPVAAYASGGVPEAVVHGRTGLLAPEGDVAGLAARIAELLANGGMWRRMSAEGQAHARGAFDVRRQAAALEAMYDEVLRAHRVPAMAAEPRSVAIAPAVRGAA